MLRAGPETRQRKRLSFKEPEVEPPHPQKDRSYQTTQAVPNTSSEHPSSECNQISFYNTNSFGFANLVETVIDDSSPTEEETYNAYEQDNFRTDIEFEEFSAVQSNSDMRCPPNYGNGEIVYSGEEKMTSSPQHQVQLLRYQLDQQAQRTQLALHQAQLLAGQLDAEAAARRNAQEQNNLLLGQNQELLKHIEKLFQQIEELEQQIQFYESEKRSRIPHIQEPQVMQARTQNYTPTRRISSDMTPDKPAQTQIYPQTSKRSSLTPSKPTGPPYKFMSHATSASTNKRGSAPSPKPHGPSESKTNPSTRDKDTLHIGDMSPTIQPTSSSPFALGWKPKSVEQVQVDSSNTLGRMRTGSFSACSRLKPPENISGKSGFNTTPGPSAIGSKKYSSSTSDLYNNVGVYQVGKSAPQDEPSVRLKSAVSNASVSGSSKLPRYQAYTGWQNRRNSLVKDYELSTKDKSKYSAESSFQQMN